VCQRGRHRCLAVLVNSYRKAKAVYQVYRFRSLRQLPRGDQTVLDIRLATSAQPISSAQTIANGHERQCR
jgi:hypothetical protein